MKISAVDFNAELECECAGQTNSMEEEEKRHHV